MGFRRVVINIKCQELKRHRPACIGFGTLTLDSSQCNRISDVNDEFCISILEENQLHVIETSTKVECDNSQVIDMWISYIESRTITDTHPLPASLVNQLKDENEDRLRNEFINCLTDVKDEGLVLNNYDISSKCNKYLFEKFEKNVISFKRKHINFNLCFYGFEAFLSMIFLRRKYRINKWITENTKQFTKDEERGIITKFVDQTNELLHKLEVKLKLCGCECNNNKSGCKYKCLLPQNHEQTNDSVHDCFGSHWCEEACSYCISELNEFEQKHDFYDDHSDIHNKIDLRDSNLRCSYPAGHDGKHKCNEEDHSCGKPCSLSQHGNCKQKCSKEKGHDKENSNDDCKCDADIHYCSQACDASGCRAVCIISYDKQHERHDCGMKRCLLRCQVFCADSEMDGKSKECGAPCASRNHFHDDETDFHCCMREHYCGKMCEAKGICHVESKRVSELRQKRTKQGEIICYEAWTTKVNGYDKLCREKIGIGERTHDGRHRCDNDQHTCDVRCKFCLYYCDLPYNHHSKSHSKLYSKLHSITNHGNMVNTKFVSQNDNIQVKHKKAGNLNDRIDLERSYTRDDTGEAEMCHNFCISRGRGHVHVVPCGRRSHDNETCDRQEQNKKYRQHAPKDKYGKDNNNLDEMTHESFWKIHMKFRDPVQSKKPGMLKEFRKCNALCKSSQHQDDNFNNSFNNRNQTKQDRYCTGDLWHEPFDTSSETKTNGVIDGHLFNCKHPAPHVIFALDCSESMSWTDIKPKRSKSIREYRTNKGDFLSSLIGYDKQSFNNRMGGVFEAVIDFLRTRRRLGHGDKYSILLYDDKVTEVCERVELNSVRDVSKKIQEDCFSKVTWGGTNFGEAMYYVEKVMSRCKNDQFIVMFLTDGECKDCYAKHDETLTASERVTKLKHGYERFSFHGVQFGKGKISKTLKKMVTAGGGTSVKKTSVPTDLGNYFISVVEKDADVALMQK